MPSLLPGVLQAALRGLLTPLCRVPVTRHLLVVAPPGRRDLGKTLLLLCQISVVLNSRHAWWGPICFS